MEEEEDDCLAAPAMKRRPWNFDLTPCRLEKDGEEDMDEPKGPLVDCWCWWHRFSVARRVERATDIFSSSKVITAFCKKREGYK